MRMLIIFIRGDVAQLGERTVRIRKVESSILFISTIIRLKPVIHAGGWKQLISDWKVIASFLYRKLI